MTTLDDELNEFIEEVTDGAYTMPCHEVILKLVKQMFLRKISDQI